MAKLVHPDTRLDALEKQVRMLHELLKKQTTDSNRRIATLQAQIQALAQRRS